MSLEAAIEKLKWNIDPAHDEKVQLTPNQCQHLLDRINDLEEAHQTLRDARETVRKRALVVETSGERVTFADGFFDGLMEAVRIIDAALAAHADTEDEHG